MAQEQVQVNDEMIEYMSSFPGPTPGQSLTNNPDEPYPWEGPPQYTKLDEALFGIFDMITEEDMLVNTVVAISDGVPIEAIAKVILTDGFQKGSWNVDLMLMLIEPTMYMIMSVAEKAGVKYRLDDDDDPDSEEVDSKAQMKILEDLIDVSKQKIRGTGKKTTSVPEKIMTGLKELEVPASLLNKTEVVDAEETPMQEEPTSLLEQRG